MKPTALFVVFFALNACGGAVEPTSVLKVDTHADAEAPDSAPHVAVDAATDAAHNFDAPISDAGTPALCCQVGDVQITCAQEDAHEWSFGCVFPNKVSVTCAPTQCRVGDACNAGGGGVVVPCD